MDDRGVEKPLLVAEHDAAGGRLIAQSRRTESQGRYEYGVRMKGEGTDFINALAALPGVQSAVLVSYNGEYMG